MKGTMAGLVKRVPGPGSFEYRTDLPIPVIGDDEVLIKVKCTAICGTDIHIIDWDPWSQKRVRAPVVPGHETSGVIVETGKNVTDRRPGDRVSCEPHIPCGNCWFCRNGLPHICSNIRLLGVTEDGAFAEYMKIRASSTFLLDDEISFEQACLLEPMGAGVHGAEAAEPKGRIVLVSGCGPIGLAAISACKTMGATAVIACDLLEDKRSLALAMGADVFVNSAESDVIAEVMHLTNSIGADAAIDITGSGAAIRNGLKCVRAAGRFVGVGLPTKNVELDLANDLIYREIEFTGISGRRIWKTWEDFAMVMKGPYFKADLVTGNSYPLSEYEKAFDEVRTGAAGKVILCP